MKNFPKLLIAALLALGVVTGATGCSSGGQATNTTQKVDPSLKAQRAAFATALIAESKLLDQFAPQKGLENGKVVSYSVPIDKESKSLDLLSNYWDPDLVKKEYEFYLGSKALLDKANAAFQAKNEQDNVGRKGNEKYDFAPADRIADDSKLGTNDIFSAKAQFEQAKITVQDDKYIIAYKGLTYTVHKTNSGFKVVGKEGHLQK